MTLNQVMPHFDVMSKFETHISAPPAVVYRALKSTDFRQSPIIRILLWLRFGARNPKALTLESFLQSGFVMLEDRPAQEIIMGLIGRFWTSSGDRQKIAPADFIGFNNPRYGKVGFNFEIHPEGAETRLTTETRILCPSPRTRLLFRLYWTVVGPFSGVIRMEMVRLIKAASIRL